MKKQLCTFCQSEEVIEFSSPLRHEFNNVNTNQEYNKFQFCNACGKSQAIEPIDYEELAKLSKNKFPAVIIPMVFLACAGLVMVLMEVFK